MHPGRILGAIMGLVILISIFLLPFFAGLTLYGIVGPMLGGIGELQGFGVQGMTLGYLFIISFILLVIAGIVGIFPLGTGVLGVVGMAMITVAPFLVGSEASLLLSFVGIGYYVIWIASIVALGASFWHRRSQAQSHLVQVNVQQHQAQPAQIVQPVQTPPVYPVSQPPPPPTSPQTIIVSPRIDVKAESKTETMAHTPSAPPPALGQEMELKTGASYTPEDAMKIFQMLKQRMENQPIEVVEATMKKFRFRDVSSRIWTIDQRTNGWSFFDGTKWVEAPPPRILEGA